MLRKQLATIAFVLTSIVSTSVAAEWGSISGQFVYDGDVPEPVKMSEKVDPNTARDANVCKIGEKFANDLVIDKDSKGIANVFVYVYRTKKIHPDLKAEMDKPADQKKPLLFDQKACRFNPHAMFVRTDQTVQVVSADPVSHNTHTFPIRNKGENFTVSANDRKGTKLKFRTSEILPIEVKCDIHPWMNARWLILDHPYAAVTDKDGKFEIKNLPAGEIELRSWHEKSGYVVAPGLAKGRFKVTVKANDTTSVDPVKVDPASLKD